MTAKNKKSKKYTKKLTLAPLKFEEALGRILKVAHKKGKSWKELLRKT